MILFLTSFSTVSVALAQGCAMCRSTLETQNESINTVLQLGILVLLVPSLVILTIFLYIACRKESDT